MRPLLALLAMPACATRGPEAVLGEYAEALERGDAARIWELSDARFRAAHTKEDVARYLDENAAEPSRLSGELSVRAPMRVEVELSAGALVLVEELGSWRIASGGLELERANTPEGALHAFFEAVAAGRLEVVRSLMPSRHARAFARDDALTAYLREIGPRIEAAQSEMGAGHPKAAEVDGDRARIPYSTSKAVTLLKEGDRWRVVDLE